MLNLQNLHDAVERVCPIFGLADLGNGNYRIDFRPEATSEQQNAAWQVVATFEDKPILWEQFRAQILTSNAYIRISTATPVTLSLNATLVWLLGQLGGNPEVLLNIGTVWNAIAAQAQPTGTEIAELNAIGNDCNLPFRLNGQGLMVLS